MLTTNRQPPIASYPAGFTLLELLLAMAVFAGAAAMVMPTIGGLLTDRRMVRAADQVRAEMIRLRVHAMRLGRVMKLENAAGEDPAAGNQLRITSVFSATDSINAMDSSGGQASLLSGADQTVGAVATTMTAVGEESWTIELPEGVSVKSVVTSPAGGSGSVEAAVLTTSDSGATVGSSAAMPAVYFYPTGQTSNAIITLSDEASPDQYVQIRGLTGDVSVR